MPNDQAAGSSTLFSQMNRLTPLCLILVFAGFSACTRQAPPGPAAESRNAMADPATDYAQRLLATKAQYPFPRWGKNGLEQYTASVLSKFTLIFDNLIAELIAAGENAPENQKLASFRRAVTALNDLNRRDPRLIETTEAEQLCALGNVVAAAAGLNPKKYGGGEGPISEGRAW